VKRYRNGALSQRATYFAVALFFLLLFPLLPLEAECLATGRLEAKSVAVVTCTYAISVALASRVELIGWLGLIVGLLFGAVYGFALGSGDSSLDAMYLVSRGYPPMQGWVLWNTLGVGTVFLLHAAERFYRYVVNGEPFPDFIQRR
jgi:hypothetical protein